LTDFIGKEYWGRKFYFHQDLEQSVAEYKPPAWSVCFQKDNPLPGLSGENQLVEGYRGP